MTDNADRPDVDSTGQAATGSPGDEAAAPVLTAGDDRALTIYAPCDVDPEDPDEDGEATEGGEGGGAARGIALAAERDRLAKALRETHRQLADAQQELISVQRSATMELGRTLTTAAKRPWIGGPRLPVSLFRLWREHRAMRAARGAAAGAALGDGFRSPEEESWAQILLDPGTGATGDRFLAAYTLPGLAWSAAGRPDGQDLIDGLVVAGALTDRTCAALAPDATAAQLLPHDAAFVLEGSGADLVVIEAAALLPGSAWAHAGDPAAADRGRRLSDLIDLARALGKPVIFLRNAPSYLMPYLDWLARSCDAVADGGPGLQLATYNPIDLPATRDPGPVYAGSRHPRESPAAKRLLDELTGVLPADGAGPAERARLARVIGEPSWRDAPAVYRGHELFIAATAAQARAQLACGARVIGPIGEPGAPDGSANGTVNGAAAAVTAAQAAREIAAAADAGPRGLGEVKALLHELFEAHATPVRLAELAWQAGLPVQPVPGRRVAVLAGVGDAAEAGRLADGVLAQRFRPREVVVWLDRGDATRPGIAAALDRLASAGIPARVAEGTGLAAAAGAARSPWSSPWDPKAAYPASHLLEMMCALECSRADAVGTAAGADYVFTDALDPAVARTDLYRDGAPPPHAWARRGFRLFAVDPIQEGK
jgi:hypothetical protein